jgi:hypothetical protein
MLADRNAHRHFDLHCTNVFVRPYIGALKLMWFRTQRANTATDYGRVHAEMRRKGVIPMLL